VTAALQLQAGQLMSCGRNATARTASVDALLSDLLPPGMRPAGLCSTGMEVAEFAMRVAARHTGRKAFAGFARSMHGKSAMTAALCWPNAPLQPEALHRLPFVDDASEADILAALEARLRTGTLAALFVEPIQGSNRAHEASLVFYDQVIALCRQHGTLSVFDETLTGLYRSGPVFYCNRLQSAPDVLLFAKSLGNGFPVASIALGAHIVVRAEALPGSTFSANAMALAAVESTLTAMAHLPMRQLVADIETTVLATAPALAAAGALLRGRGALWCIEFADAQRARRVHAATRAAGLLLSCTEYTSAIDVWSCGCIFAEVRRCCCVCVR
jgi:acetylornithine/succinyldiaminopimelate/putrescine aminotransferase